MLLALPSESWPKDHQMVVENEIFGVIEQEYLLSKHASQDTIWASIRGTYYGISQAEVKYLIKQCGICHKKAVNRSRGPLTPIISTELFEYLQLNLINFRY